MSWHCGVGCALGFLMTATRTYALLSQKGGSGKSTLAASLAGHWHHAGKTVAVLDTDPLGALTSCWPSPTWTMERTDARTLNDVVRRLQGAHQVVVIDTPGFQTAAAVAALALSDVAIIPARPSLPDVLAAAQVLEQVAELNKARREHPVRPVVVFTQVPAQGRVAAHMIDEARRLKLPLAPHVGMRAVFAEAALRGSTPTELEPAGKGAAEVAALARYLERFH